MMYRWLVLIALMMALSACTSDSAERENVSSQAVSLQQGAVSGVASPYDAGISVFRGLPYAAAPVGDLRNIHCDRKKEADPPAVQSFAGCSRLLQPRE